MLSLVWFDETFQSGQVAQEACSYRKTASVPRIKIMMQKFKKMYKNFEKMGGQLIDLTVYIIICEYFLFAGSAAAWSYKRCFWIGNL